MITSQKNSLTWTADDEHSSTHELGDLLYGLIRMEKPKLLIETGTYQGHATRSMVLAIINNKMDDAAIHTCDTVDHSRSLGRATFHHCSGVDMIAKLEKIDFAYLDSGGSRIEEAQALYPRLSRMSMVVINNMHDTDNRVGAEHLMDKAPNLQLLEFDTPQGVVVLRIMK